VAALGLRVRGPASTPTRRDERVCGRGLWGEASHSMSRLGAGISITSAERVAAVAELQTTSLCGRTRSSSASVWSGRLRTLPRRRSHRSRRRTIQTPGPRPSVSSRLQRVRRRPTRRARRRCARRSLRLGPRHQVRHPRTPRTCRRQRQRHLRENQIRGREVDPVEATDGDLESPLLVGIHPLDQQLPRIGSEIHSQHAPAPSEQSPRDGAAPTRHVNCQQRIAVFTVRVVQRTGEPLTGRTVCRHRQKRCWAALVDG